MAGIMERLTEGIVNRDLRAEGSALLNKWERTGLLEGLETESKRQTMARLLENQAKELLRESSSMAAGDVEGFAAVAFPIVRRVFAGLIANDLVSVQPMSLPSGLIFFLDFVFSPNVGASSTLSDRFGNFNDKSIYGTNQVASQITGGVSLVSTSGSSVPGPRNSARGYAYASPTASVMFPAGPAIKDQFLMGGGTSITYATEAQLKLIQWDPDLVALSGGSTAYKVLVLDFPKATYVSANADMNNLAAFEISSSAYDTSLDSETGTGTISSVRRLTHLVASGDTPLAVAAVRHVAICPSSSFVAAGSASVASYLGVQVPLTDNLTNASALGAVVGTTTWGLEGNEQIPEIDIKVDSIAVTRRPRSSRLSGRQSWDRI